METPLVVLGKLPLRHSSRSMLMNLRVLRHTLIPPRGYSIAGVSGSCGSWIDGFSLIIAR